MALAVGLITVVFALPACGGDDDGGDGGDDTETLSSQKVDGIETQLQSSLGGGSSSSFSNTPSRPTVSSVDCPDDVEAKEGTEFDCELDGDAGQGTVTVTLQSDDASSYKYKSEYGGVNLTGTVQGG